MQKETVHVIREFNRFYTSIIGIVNDTYLESPYSLAEVRVLYEVNTRPGITARQLKDIMRVDEGYLSRMVSKLVKLRLIIKKQSAEDKRVFALLLTPTGKSAIDKLDGLSDNNIQQLTAHLNPKEKQRLADLLQSIQQLLSRKN